LSETPKTKRKNLFD